MNEKFKNIIDKFNQKLNDELLAERISLKKSNEGIHLCNNALYLLKEIVEEHGFDNSKAEIHFFKSIKSEPLSLLVYFSEVRSCELLMPKIGVNNQLSFLKKKIRRINKFFNHNWDFVHYMEQELNYLDNQYFTRENQQFPVYALPEACYLDPKFFTSKDMLWARIRGMNRFSLYVKNLIKEIVSENIRYMLSNKRDPEPTKSESLFPLKIEESVSKLQDSLDYLRLSVKYMVFDLEATRRENVYLRKLVEQIRRDSTRRPDSEDQEFFDNEGAD